MRVAFYCGENFVRWGPASLYAGIGGSEEAAIHMASHLARIGCEVTVYGDPPTRAPVLHEGVRWLRHSAVADDSPGDVFIAWRDPEFIRFGAGWRQVYHWLHNRQEFPYPEVAAARIDRLLVVSRHHASDPGLRTLDPRKIYCTSNGLDPEFLRPAGLNQPDRAIYASCPARGLLTVLEMWPRIRRALPMATLDVFHGFTEVYEAMAVYYPGLRAIKYAVLQLLDQRGITYHGMVGQDRLADGFARAGVWLYPTECPETSCITAMKALAMGCLPVTSGYAVLPETLGGRDLGPVHPTHRITTSRRRLWSFRRRVIRAMKGGDRPAVAATRLAWSRWARERYSWARIANDWLTLFRQVDAGKGN
jgi:glycosyltransferase involved in cell wall biosynthesis